MPRTLLASGASLAMTCGVGWVVPGLNLAEDQGFHIKDILTWTKCVPGHFGQAQISRTSGHGPSVSVDVLGRTKCSARNEEGNGLKKGHSRPLSELQLRCTSPGSKVLCPTSHCSPKPQFLEVLFFPWRV